MKILQTFGIAATPSQTTATWTAPAQRTTILDTTNPLSIRIAYLSSNGIAGQKGSTVAGIPMADFWAALVTLEPALAYAPLISVQPPNTTADYGQSTSIALTATAEVTITYQWQISTDGGLSWSNLSNSGVYSNATTATLGISSTTGLHGNQYRCIATDAGGSTNSLGAVLTVVPHISSQPANSSVTHPTGTTFGVTATGTATMGYQWQLSTDAGSTWSNVTNAGIYSGATSSTLTLASTTSSSPNMNGYKYRVIITDGNGQTKTSSAATLTVA